MIRAFKYYGGRTQEIVYDQDRVMTVSENAGDLILTETLKATKSMPVFQSVSAEVLTLKAKVKSKAL